MENAQTRDARKWIIYNMIKHSPIYNGIGDVGNL